MRRIPAILAVLFIATAQAATAQAENMSFFVTSANPGNGADLGGLEGADAYCETLAEAVGAGGRGWRAYLSTTGPGGVDARDRIGSGPWYNYEGTQIARDLYHLHSNGVNLTKASILTETGEILNGRGDEPNMHDVLTGSTMEGTASDADGDTTCSNWTTSSSDGSALVGHHDRTGGGPNPTSWNSAHASRGCSLDDLRGTGGDGRFFCFAVDAGGGALSEVLWRER
jgi:hypothetical protein